MNDRPRQATLHVPRESRPRVIASDSHSRYSHAMPSQSPPPTPPRIDSQSLLRGQVEVEILHGQEVYRLRHTRAGKLILTK